MDVGDTDISALDSRFLICLKTGISATSIRTIPCGGFAHDDTNVMLLVSNPSIEASTVHTSVGTAQVAPTILKALGLNPSALDAVRDEGTDVLPAVQLW